MFSVLGAQGFQLRQCEDDIPARSDRPPAQRPHLVLISYIL